MHELGIVTHIAKTLDEVAKDNGLNSIATVTVEIGEVSGILLDYFTDCWDYFKVKNPILKDCKMIIETIPALTYCEDCHQTYETVRYAKICPHCGSEHTYLLQGNECNIKQIEVED
ncbi:MAG: hydrogenase maturation nickel metallochaperone HypA [Erysipelotrichaceae bacterium]|nr:hydrogenase maturation nickel metallochaperone HypA [Erysipelotrichaceae bacterium]